MTAILRYMRANPRVVAISFAVAMLLPILLAERTGFAIHYVMPDHGGRGTIYLRLLYLIPIITGLLSLALTPKTFSSVFRMRFAFVGLACIAVDVAVFALSGVLERSFKATAALPLPATASAGAVLTGIAIFSTAPLVIDYLVAATTSVSAVVGAFQLAEAYGYRSLIGAWVVRWDLAAAESHSTTVAWMRAEGLALNPNVYTPFAVVGFVWALFGERKGPLRWVILATSVAIAVLGQSRTTLVVMIALLLIAFVRALRNRTSSVALRRALPVSIIVVLMIIAVVMGRSAGLGTVSATQTLTATESLVTDPMADSNVAARAQAWHLAIHAISQNPWGWFQRAYAQLKPFAHTHNEFLYRLIYAGPFWLLAHIIFLLWLALWLQPRSMQWIGPAIASALLLNGLTEPLSWMAPYTVLMFVIIGCAMYAKAAESS